MLARLNAGFLILLRVPKSPYILFCLYSLRNRCGKLKKMSKEKNEIYKYC